MALGTSDSTAQTITALDGFHKDVYGDKLERIIPQFAKAQTLWPFKTSHRIGKSYKKPVAVALEWGITHAPPAAGAFELMDPVAQETQESEVYAYQHVLRSRMAYDTAAQAVSGGKEAFANATETLYETMVESMRRRLELDLLGYSQYGCAQVSGTPNANVVTISDATWAPGMWVAAKNAQLYVFNTNAYSADTLRQGLGGASTDYYYTVSSVDIDNKTITVDDDQNIADGDYIWFRSMRSGAGTAKWSMYGLRQIATTSGTLFGIDNSSYDIFKGLTYSAGSTDLSIDTIQRAAARMAVMGVDGNLLLWCSPTTFANVVNDLAALVRYDQKTESKYVIGAENVTIWTPFGKCVIEAHPCVMEGEAFLFSPRLFVRSGATDVTFNRIKMAGGAKADGQSFYRELEDNAGYEIRCYSNQFLYTHRPAGVCLINNIVNS